NFFFRKKKFPLSPQAPLSLSRKTEFFCAFRWSAQSMLSPEIIHRAIRGTLPEDISLAKLYKLPDRWDEQLMQLGIAVE
ncbi:MAG: hypothetical protein IKB71_00455, partial [Lentisphaeria bacterium]|nr:hypothetical protein [Lentisphaeria bacterium]